MSDVQVSDRITAINLDEQSIVRWSPEIEHERDVAMFDLLECNRFRLASGFSGPYEVVISLRDATLVFAIANSKLGEHCEVSLSAKPLRRVIKDYFMICESYFTAIKGASPTKIESIDMARRGLHNEGAELLSEAISEQVEIDNDTARRLFTLVCVLHLRS